MKVLLLCAAGFSTGLISEKVNKYCSANHIDLQIEAHAVQEFTTIADQFDVILLGPQIAYKLASLKSKSDKPIAVIDGYVYATADAEAVLDQVKKLAK